MANSVVAIGTENGAFVHEMSFRRDRVFIPVGKTVSVVFYGQKLVARAGDSAICSVSTSGQSIFITGLKAGSTYISGRVYDQPDESQYPYTKIVATVFVPVQKTNGWVIPPDGNLGIRTNMYFNLNEYAPSGTNVCWINAKGSAGYFSVDRLSYSPDVLNENVYEIWEGCVNAVFSETGTSNKSNDWMKVGCLTSYNGTEPGLGYNVRSYSNNVSQSDDAMKYFNGSMTQRYAMAYGRSFSPYSRFTVLMYPGSSVGGIIFPKIDGKDVFSIAVKDDTSITSQDKDATINAYPPWNGMWGGYDLTESFYGRTDGCRDDISVDYSDYSDFYGKVALRTNLSMDGFTQEISFIQSTSGEGPTAVALAKGSYGFLSSSGTNQFYAFYHSIVNSISSSTQIALSGWTVKMRFWETTGNGSMYDPVYGRRLVYDAMDLSADPGDIMSKSIYSAYASYVSGTSRPEYLNAFIHGLFYVVNQEGSTSNPAVTYSMSANNMTMTITNHTAVKIRIAAMRPMSEESATSRQISVMEYLDVPAGESVSSTFYAYQTGIAAFCVMGWYTSSGTFIGHSDWTVGSVPSDIKQMSPFRFCIAHNYYNSSAVGFNAMYNYYS
jgi:hypothetical protein